MTYEEAILIIENETPHCGEKLTFSEGEICEAASIAKKAIGKQIPKKPYYVQYDGNPEIGNYHCPACEKILELEPIDHNEKVSCLHCGQAIDWSDEE